MLSGGSADNRCDVYQLGLTLYTIVNGAPPFQGTVRDILRQIGEESPQPLRRNNQSGHVNKVPRELETICMKAIAREPDDRYQSSVQFADDLKRFLAGDPISARPPGVVAQFIRTARKHRVKSAVAAVAVPCLFLLLAAYASIRFQRAEHERENARIAAERQASLRRLADETHRADVAELKSNQVLSQSLTTVLSAQRIREPNWVDAETTIKSALLEV